MPALSADIVKFLLGYYEVGLYIDIGLKVYKPSSLSGYRYYDCQLSQSLKNIIDNNRKFKAQTVIAFTSPRTLTMDFQLLYFTNDNLCLEIYKEIIEKIYNPPVGVEWVSSLEKSKIDFRTFEQHDGYPISETAVIVNLYCAQDSEVFTQLLNEYDYVKDIYKIPLDSGSRNLSIAGLAFKEREESFIADYKKKTTDQEVRSKLARAINGDLQTKKSFFISESNPCVSTNITYEISQWKKAYNQIKKAKEVAINDKSLIEMRRLRRARARGLCN